MDTEYGKDSGFGKLKAVVFRMLDGEWQILQNFIKFLPRINADKKFNLTIWRIEQGRRMSEIQIINFYFANKSLFWLSAAFLSGLSVMSSKG